uniref:CD3e molecule, epsilon associated protein n=1 Tax=Doryrhamphus excisus TaxID=161450 RepID=UPI0025AE4493|nr:CD3e molecule, epsilon associated protein [Doryrhamphus excisus]
MLRDVSPSSSEDEAEKSTEEVLLKQKEPEKRTSRYKCPDDFVPFRHKPCKSTLTDSLKNSNSELWLIKAPASFNPECLQGVNVSLSSLQTLKFPSAVDGGESRRGQQIYNILGSTHGTSELHLLTGDTASSPATVMGPAFAGLLSVSESYGGTRQTPQIIPATPAPTIPPGLKQRFLPFGSKTPTQGRGSEADGVPLLEVTQVGEEGRKRKKSKLKKEKHVNAEREDEEVTVKHEDTVFQEAGPPAEKRRKKRKKVRDEEESPPPTAKVMVKQEVTEDILFHEAGVTDSQRADREEEEVSPASRVTVKQDESINSVSFLEDNVEEKRRKKRKKKDREMEEESPAAMVMIKQEVKSELVDTLCNWEDDGSPKKKKKKKKSKSDDD